MNEIIDKAPQYIELATSIIGVASIIAAMTPTPADDGILLVIKRIIGIFALNIGHAKTK